MGRGAAKAIAALGALLLVVSLISTVVNLAAGVERPTDLGSFDFLLRTGGGLMLPSSENDSYRLTHSMYDPGNTTVREIENFEEFWLCHQMALAISLLENGSESDAPIQVKGGAYDILLNLTTDIQVDTPDIQTVRTMEHFMNLHLNESTAQGVILPMDIFVTVVDAKTAVEFSYDETTTVNNGTLPAHEIVVESRSFKVQLVTTMNITLDSEWTAHFVSPAASDVMYAGHEVVGEFYVNKTPDSNCRLTGFLRCFFIDGHVSVLIQWVPFYEILVATIGIVLVSCPAAHLYGHSKPRIREAPDTDANAFARPAKLQYVDMK